MGSAGLPRVPSFEFPRETFSSTAFSSAAFSAGFSEIFSAGPAQCRVTAQSGNAECVPEHERDYGKQGLRRQLLQVHEQICDPRALPHESGGDRKTAANSSKFECLSTFG